MISPSVSRFSPVGVISKVLRILEALNASPAGLCLREVAETTGINKSTAYRFLVHLERERYLFRDESGAYMIGPRLLRLGSGATYQMTLRKLGRPVLQELRDTTGETVNLGVLDGQSVLYVDVVQSRHPFRMASRIGSSRPLYCTAMGKALAALLPPPEKERVLHSLHFQRFTPRTIMTLGQLKRELEKTEQRGYALDDEETTLGARCIGVPILVQEAKVAAAVSVSGPTARMAQERIAFFVKATQAAARTISLRLNGAEAPPN